MTVSDERAAQPFAQEYLLRAIYGSILDRVRTVSIPPLVNYAHAHNALVALYETECEPLHEQLSAQAARVAELELLAHEAFDFLGGADDAVEIRAKLLAALNQKDQTDGK